MTRDELAALFKDLDDGKRAVLETTYDDFIHEYEQLELIKTQIKRFEEPKSQREADKLKYFTRLYSDVSQRHDGKVKMYLTALQKDGTSEDNPIAVWIKERQKK